MMRIGARVERRFLAEHVHADDVLLQRVATTGRSFRHDELEEQAQAIDGLERRAAHDPAELLLDRSLRYAGRAVRTSHGLLASRAAR